MLAQTIRASIEHGDYLRRASLGVAGRVRHKEWLHFCCATPELDLIVNLSVVSEPDGEMPRLLCAVRTRGWDGDVDCYPAEQVVVFAGSPGICMGESFVRFTDGRYRLRVRMRKRPIRVDLELVPLAIASQANNIDLGRGPELHWFLVPQLAATGEVNVGGRCYQLHDVPAYHDHNWGAFGWGHDYAWIWGYGHGQTRGQAWTLVFDRLSNRARTGDLVRNLLLWRGGRQHRLFAGHDLQIVQHGVMRPERFFKLPRVAGLFRPEHCSDVPKRLCVEAEARGDRLEFTFEPDDLCQIVTPNDDDLECTVINEACGRLAVDGCIRGERLHFETRSTFEFLHG